MFYGSRRHLKSFSGNFLVLIFSLGCLLTYLVKNLAFTTTIFEKIIAKHCPPFLGIPMTWNHLESRKVLLEDRMWYFGFWKFCFWFGNIGSMKVWLKHFMVQLNAKKLKTKDNLWRIILWFTLKVENLLALTNWKAYDQEFSPNTNWAGKRPEKGKIWKETCATWHYTEIWFDLRGALDSVHWWELKLPFQTHRFSKRWHNSNVDKWTPFLPSSR